MPMTFDQYIQNPMGIANSVISNREMYRKMYTEKWDRINLREHGEVKYRLYKSKSGSYYAYIKIPSEVVENFYYDTVIKFIPPTDGNNKNSVRAGNSLKDYNVKFFSNDPSFVFTFAHAFIKNDIFIKELAPKMSKLAIKNTATEKNPNNQVGYVKSLYFAYIIMNRRGLFNKLHYVTPLNKNELEQNIMQADDKIASRQEAGKTLANNNRKKVKLDIDAVKKKKRNTLTQVSNTINGISTTKIVNNIKKSTGTVKKTNTIKTVKKK